MLVDLCILQNNVKGRKYDIEDGIDKMYEGKKARDEKRKKILLNEMKNILFKLDKVDDSIMKDLKGEAFDFLRTLSNINKEIDVFNSALMSDPKSSTNWRTKLNALKSKVENLEMDDFVGCLKISVGVQQEYIDTGFEKIPDAIFLETSALRSKDFSLEIPEQVSIHLETEFNPNYIEIKIYDSNNRKFSKMLLQKMMITMTSQVYDIGTVIEECSVESKIEKKKAQISEDGKILSIKLQRPRHMVVEISVNLLGSNIMNSPGIHLAAAPNKVSEMQKSLSGSKSRAGDRATCQLDKTLTFAPQVMEVLEVSLSQVAVTGGQTRPDPLLRRIQDGLTKDPYLKLNTFKASPPLSSCFKKRQHMGCGKQTYSTKLL